ncbi:regulator Ustilago maydis 1 protein (Rum1) [Sporisorium scitamineum]|uniref:Regulator Ustilago maydis 1 protein (Rum1) n=1 Tax=Sporisorium scitamineum TaxID=49012 RepID=A0A0F7RX16_9BASI|nr:hypothetical protein [Sporisorium scitamineum]CDU22804.1 regulator Ustilago maydis 1 protein (Rum1) [Sporisorium scitamineum]
MTPTKTGAQSSGSSDTPQRIIVKSVNGHEPIKAEPASSSSASALASTPSQLSTPLSSPSKSTAAPSSPTKSPGRPRRVEPVLVSSRDFGQSAGGDSDQESNDGESELKQGATVKRLSRKSKADAISAISGKESSPVDATSTSAENAQNGRVAVPGNPAAHPARKMFQHQPFPPLAFDRSNTASTSTQPAIPTSASTPHTLPPRLRPRLFELEEAPTFRPTLEEFADPMKYISWIADPQGGNGKAYGIVKIIPPEGWNPECVLDEQTFRFRTRVQRLNSLSADARASQNYQEQLQKFHAQQGRKRVSVPVIDGRSVDLYQLKLVISSLGGYDAVCRGRKWSDATRKIGCSDRDSGQLSTQVKAAYTRIILPFEEFLTKAKEQSRANGSSTSPHLVQSATMGATSSSDPQENGVNHASMSPSLDAASNDDRAALSKTPEPFTAAGAAEALANATPVVNTIASQSPSTVASTRRSARKRSEANTTPASSSRNPLQLASSPATPLATRRRKGASPLVEADPHVRTQAAHQGQEEQMCEICLRGEDGLNMLLCDECNRGYHMYCLQPALTSIPKSQWFCPPCLVGTGHDFGFDDGETHSLYTFWQRAEAFKREWWTKHQERLWNPDEQQADSDAPTNGVARPVHGTDLVVSEDDVEREFWRLVHSQMEEVEVEYGADVHSTTHGSALPTQETHPLSLYSRDKWNLNNLPILPGSLLQFIKSDISGMTVPWIYVGMIFSTFCWHNEDHYTYSINYQHWGETKTWYGIPGEDAEKFENAMRKAAPDLFETLPDLLFHLTTMMSPEKLKKEGVRVVACDQRANEFVVTFPKAYHSGFNHGFNLNEAVNFALPDWIFDDLESSRRYQRFRKPAVFSHDQLLITVSQQSQTIETAVWLEAAMQEMVNREIAKRNALREIIPDLKEEVYDEDVAETEYICAHCTLFCYLGQLTSPKADGVACLDHGFEVCNADAPVKWTLKLRFSDDQLRAILAKVSEKAAIPRNWIQRLKKTLALGPKPPLKTLRSLLHEGEKIAYSLEPLEDLKTFVNCANSWVERANVFLVRKLHKRRGEPAAAPTARGRRPKSGAAGDDSFSRRQSLDASADDADACADRSPEALYALIEELDSLHFDAPEIASLRTLVQELEEFIGRCNDILRQRDANEASLKDCESVLTLGSSLNVDAPQIKELSDYVERRKWVQEVTEARDTYLYYHEVQELLERADACGLGDHALRNDLEQKRDAGRRWTERTREVLEGSTPITVGVLEELSDSSADVPVVLEVAQDVSAALAKAKELQKTAQTLYKGLQAGAQGNTVADAEGDLSMISISENSEAAERMALLPDARRLLRAAKSNGLELEHLQDIEKAVQVYDAWRAAFNQIMQTSVSGTRRLTDADRDAELNKLVERIENATDPSDDQPRANSRNCICRSSVPIAVPSSTNAECCHCRVRYHLSCIKVRSSEVSRADGNWTCPFCPWHANAAFLKARKAISVTELSKLVYDQDHRRDQFKFLPLEWDAIEEVVAKAKRFETAAKRMIKTLSLMRRDQKQAILSHWLRRSIACPIDVLGPEKVNMLDLISENLLALGPEPEDGRSYAQFERTKAATPTQSEDRIEAAAPLQSTSRPSAPADRDSGSPAIRDDRKRKAKRGKRAKLVFREEIGIGAYRDRQPIYCLCHEPESGRMIACDKCMLWFHTHCVCLDDPPNLGNEPWNCPMCCIKAERKYPQAEVRVKDIGVTDPDLWLDIRATLRSLEKPVSKVQSWSSPENKRIVLHLDKFTPAIHAEEVHSQISKRARLESDTPSKARPSLGRSDSMSTPAKESGALPYAPPPVPSEAARGIVPAASTPAIPSQSAAEMPGSKSARNDDSFAAASPPQWEAKTGPSPGNASLDWAQAARRRNAEGMDNLYRRGITDAMLMRFYIGWNGRSLVHSLRDAAGNIIEISLGEAIRLHADDPEGVRVVRAAIDRHSARMERSAPTPALSNSRHTYGGEVDDHVYPRSSYVREDGHYPSQRRDPPIVPSNGRFDMRSPAMVPSQRLGADRDYERERERDLHDVRDNRDGRDARFGDSLRSPATSGSGMLGTSPALRPSVARDGMPTYARSSVDAPTAISPYAGAAVPSHSLHASSDRFPPYHAGRSSADGVRGPPSPMPTYSSAKAEPLASASNSAYASLPLDPAMMADDAAGQIDPSLTRSPLPASAPAPVSAAAALAPAAASAAAREAKSPIPNGKVASETAAAPSYPNSSKEIKKEQKENTQNFETVREQARQMARRMRPDASEAEIERLVQNFVGGAESV